MSTAQSKSYNPKRIVYLWGAGATQAEISYLGANTVNLLMRDNQVLGEGVSTRILKRLPTADRTAFLTDNGTDIEKLISLLASCNVERYSALAETIRQFYFEDICDNLAKAEVLSNPQLAIALLSLHANAQFQREETLSAIITTNHDGLLQLAAKEVHAGVDLGIPFHSKDLAPKGKGDVVVLHLHGSFTWTFGVPINVSLLSAGAKYSPDTVWIPPTILKESKNYPFNKLSALAYEFLAQHCDVLRVVGSALTQNDWNVLSMIFSAQRHRELTRGTPFRIELIMPQEAGESIVAECSYLKHLTPIGYLSEGAFAGYTDATSEEWSAEMSNPLFYWLKQKIGFHQNRGDFGSSPLTAPMSRIAGDIP